MYTVTQDRDTTDWRRVRNLVKLAELSTLSLCRELLVGLLLGVAKDGRELSL